MAPQTVGADHHMGAALVAVGRGYLHGVGVLADELQGVVQQQLRAALGLHGAQQQAVQIGAGNGGVTRAVALHRTRAQRQLPQHRARLRAAHLQQRRKAGHRVQAAAQAPAFQQAHHVGAELDACAHFREHGILLDQLHRQATRATGQRGGQATNATADNEYLFLHVGHCHRGVPRPIPPAKPSAA